MTDFLSLVWTTAIILGIALVVWVVAMFGFIVLELSYRARRHG